MNVQSESGMDECSASSSLDECVTAAALYALDALSEEEKRQFAQRLAGRCPFCTEQVAEFGEVAEVLPFTVPLRELPPELKTRLMERISCGEPAQAKPPIKVSGALDGGEPHVVRGEGSRWMGTPMPGVEMRQLLGEKTVLVRMQPGSSFPEHHHYKNEQCYVLEGTISQEDGLTVQAGDFVCMPAGSTHRPIQTATGCVLLIAYTA